MTGASAASLTHPTHKFCLLLWRKKRRRRKEGGREGREKCLRLLISPSLKFQGEFRQYDSCQICSSGETYVYQEEVYLCILAGLSHWLELAFGCVVLENMAVHYSSQ